MAKSSLENNDESAVNILVPMAGMGSRFVQAGFTEPKPLIPVLGKTLVEWAMQSFDFLNKLKNYRLIFVVLHEHIEKNQIDKKLQSLFGERTVIVPQTGFLNGQSKSCMLAKQHIDNGNKLFIYNCDTYMTSNIWDVVLHDDPDGIIPCFEATNPSYSYAKINDQGDVIEVAEKQAISNLATIGMYYFKQGSDYVRAAETQFAANKTYNNEFYVGPCYNELIAAGKRIKIAKIFTRWVIGTPEELKKFEEGYKITQ